MAEPTSSVPISPLVSTKSPEQIEAERAVALAEKQASEAKAGVMRNLAADLRDKYTLADTSFVSKVLPRLTTCKRASRMEYDPMKLRDIKAAFGPYFDPPYRPIIAGKKRDLVAWLREFLCKEDVDIWTLVPNPIPQLPKKMQKDIEDKIYAQAIQAIGDAIFASNQDGQIPIEAIQNMVVKYAHEIQPEIHDRALKEMQRQAKKSVERMVRKIETQLNQGKFNLAIKEFIDDVALYPNAFLQGPIQRRIPVQSRELSETTGKWETKLKFEVISTYERVSPWNIRNQPDAKNINDGYIFILRSFSPKSLSDCLDAPGYDNEEIRAVLQEYRTGGLREWNGAEAVRAALEDRDTGYQTDKIDGMEYQGSASGKMLKEWAGTNKASEFFGEDLDDAKEYPIVAWMVGTHIIKAMLNEDHLGEKNLYTASIDEDPDNFWSPTSLPEYLMGLQNSSNALAIAMVINSGLSSGPVIQYDKDRFPDGVIPSIHPMLMIPSTVDDMKNAPPVNYLETRFIAHMMIRIDQYYMTLADTYSGIPRGIAESRVTASAESMKAAQQARGIKSVLNNIDMGVIERAIDKQYQFNLRYEDDGDLIGDCRPVAKGSNATIAKEQQAIRRNEYVMGVFNNPTRQQLIGAMGLRELEKATAQGYDFDLEKIFGDMDVAEKLLQDFQAGGGQGGAAPQKGANVNGAGDLAQGKDFQTVGNGAAA